MICAHPMILNKMKMKNYIMINAVTMIWIKSLLLIILMKLNNLKKN